MTDNKDIIDAEGQFSTNRSDHVRISEQNEASVLVKGPATHIVLEGRHYFKVDVLKGICTKPAYDDEPSTELGLGKLFITHKYFVRKDGEELYWDRYVRERFANKGTDIHVDVPLTKSLVKVAGLPLEGVEVGVVLESGVDSCGTELLPKSQVITLNVDWDKTATNSCQSCVISS